MAWTKVIACVEVEAMAISLSKPLSSQLPEWQKSLIPLGTSGGATLPYVIFASPSLISVLNGLLRV